MTALFNYPPAAAFGGVIPKSAIYRHARVNAKLRRLFVEQIERVIWQYKLAPETINLDSTDTVREIQVLHIHLRVAQYSQDILRAIDKAIAHPIIFELVYDGKRKVIAALKRASSTGGRKYPISAYLESEWLCETSPRKPLPLAVNLGLLYSRILSSFIPNGIGDGESISARVERVELIRAKQREVQRIKERLKREKQFNRRVDINAELRNVTGELKRLGAVVPAKQ